MQDFTATKLNFFFSMTNLNDNGTFIFASNIVNFLNNFILNRNI